MKIIAAMMVFSSLALASENPTKDQIRLKLWYEGVSAQKPRPETKFDFKPQIEEIERPLQKLFTQD